MITPILSFVVLVVGYFTYGKLVERTFGPDDRMTPANSMTDGVDYMPMKTWRAYLVQLLNIAGTGPIFGALMGACFGPEDVSEFLLQQLQPEGDSRTERLLRELLRRVPVWQMECNRELEAARIAYCAMSGKLE